MKRACVIGWPISHSRSPLIHNYWLKQYGIEGEYTRIPVEPSNLANFISTLEDQGLEGCNVTIPHKEAAFGLIIPADEATRRLGVANTIFRRDGKTYGTSTDGEGYLASLRAASPFDPGCGPAMMLGAGGAATAVAGALLDAGVPEIIVANRTMERAEALRKLFGQRIRIVQPDHAGDVLSECALLVNTTSQGMTGYPEISLDLTRLPSTAIVSDLVYVPLETGLLRRARERGLHSVGGLGMLLHQAVRGFELWFGRRPEVTADLYDLVAADVAGSNPA
jgi:shikimate dehydrogenase